MQKIGVFVCHCGSNIAATVDVARVAEEIRKEPGVVHAEDYPYMCSEAGQAKIASAIKEKGLTAIVVCSCSPGCTKPPSERRLPGGLKSLYGGNRQYQGALFLDTQGPGGGHRKGGYPCPCRCIQSESGYASAAGRKPGDKKGPGNRGGIAGIQTALDIADAGYEVDIVEKTPSIGGRMSQLDKTFPTLDCSACILTPKMVEAAAHEKITLYTYSEVESISGFVGDFYCGNPQKAEAWI